MTAKESNLATTQPITCRRLPFLSKLVVFPLHLMDASLHWILPREWEPTISVLFTGGFFAFALTPVLFMYLVVWMLECIGILTPEGNAMILLKYIICAPLAVLYVVHILILDKSHVQVEHSNVYVPQTSFECAAQDFLAATFDYFDWPCVPWADDATLPTDRQYIFGVHPHGIHCNALGYLTTPGSPFDKRFPGLVGSKLTGLAATVMFKIPVVREIFLNWGYIDASRPVASRALEHGRSLFIVTGGEEESMLTTMGQDLVVLNKRKGFVRLALSYGIDLVPVFAVGGTDCYYTSTFLFPLRLWIQKKVGVCLPIFHGRFFTPLPYKIAGKVLIGKPIQTPVPKIKGARPDKELVDEYHAKYITELRALHAKHVKDRVLKVV